MARRLKYPQIAFVNFEGLFTLGLLASFASVPGNQARHPIAARPFDGHLSVLTCNVRELPWPIAKHSAENLERIARRLWSLRLKGKQPEVVLLQEAFTDDARNIGIAAGYRYVVNGRSSSDTVYRPQLNGLVRVSERKAADWQFFESGRSSRIFADSIGVPFGRETNGAMLSGLVGYTVNYRIEKR